MKFSPILFLSFFLAIVANAVVPDANAVVPDASPVVRNASLVVRDAIPVVRNASLVVADAIPVVPDANAVVPVLYEFDSIPIASLDELHTRMTKVGQTFVVTSQDPTVDIVELKSRLEALEVQLESVDSQCSQETDLGDVINDLDKLIRKLDAEVPASIDTLEEDWDKIEVDLLRFQRNAADERVNRESREAEENSWFAQTKKFIVGHFRKAKQFVVGLVTRSGTRKEVAAAAAPSDQQGPPTSRLLQFLE